MSESPHFISIKRLGDNADYYNNVFKRTESIVSAVFYILSYTNTNNINTSLLETLSNKAHKVHDSVMQTLTARDMKDSAVQALQQELLSLKSTLQISVAGRLITNDVASVIMEQIDTVQRYCANRQTGVGEFTLDSFSSNQSSGRPAQVGSATLRSSNLQRSAKPSASASRRQSRNGIPAGDISSDAVMVHSQLTDRAERIKTVLEAKPQASVKDIAAIITDVSEKTIQRELNSLIDEGSVVREGERRWSRYSVSK
jgi:hypothetical protein